MRIILCAKKTKITTLFCNSSFPRHRPPPLSKVPKACPESCLRAEECICMHRGTLDGCYVSCFLRPFVSHKVSNQWHMLLLKPSVHIIAIYVLNICVQQQNSWWKTTLPMNLQRNLHRSIVPNKLFSIHQPSWSTANDVIQSVSLIKYFNVYVYFDILSQDILSN